MNLSTSKLIKRIAITSLCLLCIAAMSAQNVLHIEDAPLYIGTDITIHADGDIFVTGASTLTNNGAIQTSGNLTLNDSPVVSLNEVEFIGNTEQTINGTEEIPFETIILNKPAESIVLSTPISVSDEIILNSGTMDIVDEDIDLGDTGNLIGEDDDNYITGNEGVITAVRILDYPALQNPGNLGLTITAPVQLGETVITRNHLATDLYTNGESVLLNYGISTAEVVSEISFLRFNYRVNDDILNNLSLEDLVPFAYNGTDWLEQTGTVNTVDRTVTVTNITSFEKLTLGESDPTISIIDRNETFEGLAVYPNPIQENQPITIENVNEPVVIKLYDFMGNLIQQNNYDTSSSTIKLDLEGLANGNYIINITSNTQSNKTINYKLTKL